MQEKRERLAIVTGASRGIGRAVAERFFEAGYLLVITARSETVLSEFAAELNKRAGQEICFYVAGDISCTATAERIVKAAEALSKRHGISHTVDVLVNNAGISKIGLLQELTDEEWDTLMGINLGGVFRACRAVLPGMIAAKSGSIINISSVWGVCGASCEAAYSASKGGVNALTKALAKELAPSRIAVNAIACGAIDTEMNAQLSEEERCMLAEEIPAGRMGKADEVAALCLQLAASTPYLTGQIIGLDGGWVS